MYLIKKDPMNTKHFNGNNYLPVKNGEGESTNVSLNRYYFCLTLALGLQVHQALLSANM